MYSIVFLSWSTYIKNDIEIKETPSCWIWISYFCKNVAIPRYFLNVLIVHLNCAKFLLKQNPCVVFKAGNLSAFYTVYLLCLSVSFSSFVPWLPRIHRLLEESLFVRRLNWQHGQWLFFPLPVCVSYLLLVPPAFASAHFSLWSVLINPFRLCTVLVQLGGSQTVPLSCFHGFNCSQMEGCRSCSALCCLNQNSML